MKTGIVATIILMLTLLQLSAQTWRSSLYPENWQPGFKDFEGRFLHDFSYAGYHSGLDPLPSITTNVVDITQPPYSADKTGNTDVRSIIQTAINDIGSAGGGVVYIPEGMYKVNISATANNPIKISYKNVVIRGAGPDKTFIYNDNPNVRNTYLFYVVPNTSGDWYANGTNTVTITQDLSGPTDVIPVSSVNGFKIDDWVIIRSDVTTDFINEHEMSALWNTSLNGPTFYRKIVAIDTNNKTIKVDAPTRYYLKIRDNARLYIVNPVLSEVGIENLSIGNKQSTLTGFGDEDYNTPGTAAYEVHGSHLIHVKNAINCWIRNVYTYKPTQNTGDYHLASNGILLTQCRFVTVESCNFQKSQYEGGGGNGYMYTLRGNDCLITKSTANHGRHNYDFKSMFSNGNVILRCRGENSRLASDFHMHLSMSNLFDNFTANKDHLEAKFRPSGTMPMHGHPTTQTVFWNTTGEAYRTGGTFIVESAQWKWGYIIGTQGAASAVRTSVVSGISGGYTYNSAPEDFKEGIGTGGQLQPQSLYEDQLAKRIARINAKTAQTITFGPLPAKKIGDADFQADATASSGLAVSLTSSNPAVATIVNGNIHIAGAGTSTITASQAGNAVFAPAPSVSQTLTVTTVSGIGKTSGVVIQEIVKSDRQYTISYFISETASTKLVLLNIPGQIVYSTGEVKQSTGKHSITFNTSKLTKGMYILKLTSGKFEYTEKIMIE